jgi:uncharacterized protein
MWTIIFAIISTLLILISLASVVFPLIPGGVPIAWLGLFIFAIGTGFERISLPVVIIFFLVTLLTVAIDLFAPMLGSGKRRPGKGGILGAIFGSWLGVYLLGLWGIVVGPFVGAIFGELVTGRQYLHALRIGLGTLVGLIIGGIIKIIVILTMLGFLIASWF